MPFYICSTIGTSTWILCLLTTWRTSSTVCLAAFEIMPVLTDDSGVSYLYVDHKGGEEVCTLAMSGSSDSSVTYFRWISWVVRLLRGFHMWSDLLSRAYVRYVVISAGELLFRTWSYPLQASQNFVTTTMNGWMGAPQLDMNTFREISSHTVQSTS